LRVARRCAPPSTATSSNQTASKALPLSHTSFCRARHNHDANDVPGTDLTRPNPTPTSTPDALHLYFLAAPRHELGKVFPRPPPPDCTSRFAVKAFSPTPAFPCALTASPSSLEAEAAQVPFTGQPSAMAMATSQRSSAGLELPHPGSLAPPRKTEQVPPCSAIAQRRGWENAIGLCLSHPVPLQDNTINSDTALRYLNELDSDNRDELVPSCPNSPHAHHV
jgi:hypothetical protein